MTDPDYAALRVLEPRGLFPRLFTERRDSRGLAHSVSMLGAYGMEPSSPRADRHHLTRPRVVVVQAPGSEGR